MYLLEEGALGRELWHSPYHFPTGLYRTRSQKSLEQQKFCAHFSRNLLRNWVPRALLLRVHVLWPVLRRGPKR
jgi:hypothetical protein